MTDRVTKRALKGKGGGVSKFVQLASACYNGANLFRFTVSEKIYSKLFTLSPNSG